MIPYKFRFLSIAGRAGEFARASERALDIIANWAEEWQLSISVSKCNILTIGHTGTDDTTEYYINDCQLPRVISCRDLGVTVTRDLSSSQHVNEIVNTAHQRANHIIRCFVSGHISVCASDFRVQQCCVVA